VLNLKFLKSASEVPVSGWNLEVGENLGERSPWIGDYVSVLWGLPIILVNRLIRIGYCYRAYEAFDRVSNKRGFGFELLLKLYDPS
jgi:hypothetical protein